MSDKKVKVEGESKEPAIKDELKDDELESVAGGALNAYTPVPSTSTVQQDIHFVSPTIISGKT